jgi:hypothetical protein
MGKEDGSMEAEERKEKGTSEGGKGRENVGTDGEKQKSKGLVRPL